MQSADSLKAVENSLRDLISYVLRNQFGDQWLDKSGVSSDRVSKWIERQQEDHKRNGSCDSRPLYYSDFYDLPTIFRKNWDKGFSDIFGDLKELEVLIKQLSDLRNAEAHRRELLPYQQFLAEGISGKIRTEISRYYSAMESRDSYYSRIESVRDSLGNTWSIGDKNPFDTGCMLRVGDSLQFQISASDPLGQEIEYGILPCSMPTCPVWSGSGSIEIVFTSDHVHERLWIFLGVKSQRKHHPKNEHGLGKLDDLVKLSYEILPPRSQR